MRKIILITLILSTIFTTACWDMVEVNDRIFPYSIGIDINPEEDGKDFLINLSYPNINAIGNEASSDIKSFLISSDANNIFEAIGNLGNRIQRPIYLKHLKVVIISEEVAKNPKFMRGIIDGLERDYIMNKMINLLVVKDSTIEFTKTKMDSERQEAIAGPLHEILINRQNSNEFTPRRLNMFIQDMDEKSASTIPTGIRDDKEEVIINGGAVFKDYKLIGYINAEENRSISILNEEISRGEANIDFDGANLALIITDTKVKKKLTDKNPIKIEYNLRLEGQLHQYTTEDELDGEESDRVLREMEEEIEKMIEGDLNRDIKKIQNQLGVDLLGISSYLDRFHSSLWESVEDNWDSIYPSIDIKANVEMHIRRRGLVK